MIDFKASDGSMMRSICFTLVVLVVFSLLVAWGWTASKTDGPQLPEGRDSYSALGRQLQKRIDAMQWGDGRLTILVADATLPLVAFARNDKELMTPGALMQIITAAAALDRLGPNFQFTTELALSGRIEDRKLLGDLIVRGEGDPFLSTLSSKDPLRIWDVFDRFAKLLRKRGIKGIQGRVIGDDRAFDSQRQGVGWSVDRLGAANQPSISALNFNHNCIDIHWKKGRKEGAAKCTIFPVLPKYVFFANSVQRAAKSNQERVYSRARDGNLISATGELPLKTAVHDRASIEDPARFFAEALKARLEKRKIKVDGAAVGAYTLSPAEIPAAQTTLDKIHSPPLRKLLAQMMREDLTLNAEVVLKTLGRRATGAAGNFRAGAVVLERLINDLHLPGPAPSIVDGSGLSSVNRLTAAQIVRLIRYMQHHRVAREFEALFPRAGEPGVLVGRFKTDAQLPDEEPKKKKKRKVVKITRKAPAIWAKSASGLGMEGLAGWALTRGGRRIIFAMMVNDSRTPPEILRDQLDALALRITRSMIAK